MSPSPKRTVSVNEHGAFRKSLYNPSDIEAMWGTLAELNHLAAKSPPSLRAGKDVDRVLDILDELRVEQLRSRNFEEKGSR